MWKVDYPDARILVVDDHRSNLKFLDSLLKKIGYKNLFLTTDPTQVCDLYKDLNPDLIILDIVMPLMDGFEVLEKLRELIPSTTYFPILVLTADSSNDARLKSLWLGAKDFLTKPFDSTEVILRIRNLLETRFLHLQLQNQNQSLEQMVQERTQELEESHLEILARLARAAEYRDDDTGEHTWRVAKISALIAHEIGLPDDVVKLILHASRLHDVGKIAIPDSILLKPGKLTFEEFEIMKSHTRLGAEILSGGRTKLLQMAECIALSHHEKWAGNGYPRGLKGEDIPIEGRIVTVADVFDALTHDRPYKKAWTLGEAMAEIESQKGQQFDPSVIQAFKKVLPMVLDKNLGMGELLSTTFKTKRLRMPSNVSDIK